MPKLQTTGFSPLRSTIPPSTSHYGLQSNPRPHTPRRMQTLDPPLRTTDWRELAGRILDGHSLTRDEGRAILESPDHELLGVLDGAYRLRRHHFGHRVHLHILQNAKSGMCRENCKFCSQAMGAQSDTERYRMQTVDELVAGAREAHARKAVKYCMVTATRGPSAAELDTVCEAARRIKAEMPIHLCASLGLLKPEQAEQLAAAGIDRFNHNLETGEQYYGEVCDTHTYEERVRTLRAVREAGLEICCGGIMGMGETVDDRLDLAFTLREIGVESVPVNFLDPRPGTPLGHVPKLSAADCLKSLCLFRYAHPDRDIRAAGGREVCLGDQQVMALYAANSIFVDGYLTTGGAGHERDLAMIQAAGFQVAELCHGG